MHALQEAAADRVYVAPADADAFVRALLLVHGVPEQDAATIAGCLISADLRGVGRGRKLERLGVGRRSSPGA